MSDSYMVRTFGGMPTLRDIKEMQERGILPKPGLRIVDASPDLFRAFGKMLSQLNIHKNLEDKQPEPHFGTLSTGFLVGM
ncbi:hypothetical protein ACFL6I_25800 [candidate division KSB1 bacterium]